MGPEDLNDSMPGLPPVQRAGKPIITQEQADEIAERFVQEGIHCAPSSFLGAPCPDCTPTSGGWRCTCGDDDGLTPYAKETVQLDRQSQMELENALAVEAHSDPGAITAADMVNLPKHYARFKIEPIRFICENGLDFFQGNIVKYTLRHDAKNGLEDIDKVIRYATMYRKFLAGDPDWWRAKAP